MDEQTQYLYSSGKTGTPASSVPEKAQPRLFVSFEQEIMEFTLSGTQSFGRPSESFMPDIVIVNKYISRKHGTFETTDGVVRYTAGDTTNPTIFNRNTLTPGETVELLDGDELTITTGDGDNSSDIILVCASTNNRIGIWHELMNASMDNLTGLPRKNTFLARYMQNLRQVPGDKNCIFIIEIDHFDYLVEHYGKNSADNAVRLVTDYLNSILDDRGMVSRWEENKWVGAVAADSRGTYFIMEDFGNDIRRSLIDGAFHITLSIGYIDMTKVSGKILNPEDLIRKTDEYLQDTKRNNGRDCLCEYRPQTAR